MSALDMYPQKYADKLPPDAKGILATLSDDVAQLAYDVWNAALEELSSKPYQAPTKAPTKAPTIDEFHAAIRGFLAHIERVNVRAGKQLARVVPALGVLSDKDLGVVSSVGREATIARKHWGIGYPTDTAILETTYAVAVDALAWSFLYHKFGKIPPTTPLREVLSADELELTGADPVAPVGDVLPREALAQACRDACQRAYELLVILEVELELRLGRDLGPKPAVDNVVARYFEILCDMISTYASAPGSARERSWSWKDFGEGKLKLDDAEIRRFLSPPVDNLKTGANSWIVSDLTPNERHFRFLFQEYGGWCSRGGRDGEL